MDPFDFNLLPSNPIIKVHNFIKRFRIQNTLYPIKWLQDMDLKRKIENLSSTRWDDV